MSDTDKQLSMPSKEDERAAALRANLMKRKEQARDRKEDAKDKSSK